MPRRHTITAARRAPDPPAVVHGRGKQGAPRPGHGLHVLHAAHRLPRIPLSPPFRSRLSAAPSRLQEPIPNAGRPAQSGGRTARGWGGGKRRRWIVSTRNSPACKAPCRPPPSHTPDLFGSTRLQPAAPARRATPRSGAGAARAPPARAAVHTRVSSRDEVEDAIASNPLFNSQFMGVLRDSIARQGAEALTRSARPAEPRRVWPPPPRPPTAGASSALAHPPIPPSFPPSLCAQAVGHGGGVDHGAGPVEADAAADGGVARPARPPDCGAAEAGGPHGVCAEQVVRGWLQAGGGCGIRFGAVCAGGGTGSTCGAGGVVDDTCLGTGPARSVRLDLAPAPRPAIRSRGDAAYLNALKELMHGDL